MVGFVLCFHSPLFLFFLSELSLDEEQTSQCAANSGNGHSSPSSEIIQELFSFSGEAVGLLQTLAADFSWKKTIHAALQDGIEVCESNVFVHASSIRQMM